MNKQTLINNKINLITGGFNKNEKPNICYGGNTNDYEILVALLKNPNTPNFIPYIKHIFIDLEILNNINDLIEVYKNPLTGICTNNFVQELNTTIIVNLQNTLRDFLGSILTIKQSINQPNGFICLTLSDFVSKISNKDTKTIVNNYALNHNQSNINIISYLTKYQIQKRRIPFIISTNLKLNKELRKTEVPYTF